MAKKHENDNKKNKQNNGQPESILGGKGRNLTQKADNTKQKIQKIKKVIEFLKRHPLIAKFLFWLILAIVIIIIFTMIIYSVLGEEEDSASSSFETTMQEISKTLNNDTSAEGNTQNEKSNTRKTTGGTIKKFEGDGGDGEYYYYLLYGEEFENENKKKEIVDHIKEIFARRNIHIYNNQCLLFLGLLEKNGLELDLYSKEDLEAMYMFFKAEVATSSLDLRSKDKRENDVEPLKNQIVPEEGTYKESDYNENDFSDDKLCGTIRVQKITYKDNNATTSILEYKPYDEFKNMLEANNINASNYFTVDEENNLIVAGWSSRSSNVSVTYGECYKDINELRAEIKDEYIDDQFVDNGDDTYSYYEQSAYKYRSIPYLDLISKYTLPFEFLMSLLSTTNDPNFCKELAKLAETSHITITLEEEYSTSTSITTVNHDDYKKDFGNIYAKFSGEGTESNTTTSLPLDVDPSLINRGLSQEDFSRILDRYHGGNSRAILDGSVDSNTKKYSREWDVAGSNGTQIHYEMEYTVMTRPVGPGRPGGDEIAQVKPKIQLVVLNTNELSVFKIQKFKQTNTTTTSTTQTHESEEIKDIFVELDGSGMRRINENTYHIPADAATIFASNDENILTFENVHALGDYTQLKGNNYTVKQTTTIESNSYKLEVTEIDNWYELYQKTYTEIEAEDLGSPTSNETRYLNIFKSVSTPTGGGDREYIDNLKNNQEAIEEFLRNNPDILDTTNLSNIEMEINVLAEFYFKYGKDEVTIEKSGVKYKKAGKEKEDILIKVQNSNKTALLSLSADAFGAQNKKEAENTTQQNQNNNSNNNLEKEEIYGTTDQYDNSFLYIYNKEEYKEVRKILHSIDEWSYKFMNDRNACKGMVNLVKYLLFLYDGTDEGVTEYDVTLFKPGDFNSKKFRGSAIVEWLRSYEYNDLRLLRNGQMTYDYFSRNGYRHDTVRINDDGVMQYNLAELNVSGDHSLNYSYGILVYALLSNPPAIYHIEDFAEEGIDLPAVIQQFIHTDTSGNTRGDFNGDGDGWLDADAVDRVQVKMINKELDRINKAYQDKGVILEKYELDALLAMEYGYGDAGGGITKSESIDLIKGYKEGTISKETLISQMHGTRGHPFQHSNRGEQFQIMFFEGRYILSTGEEIFPWMFGGSLADWDGETYSNDLYTFPVYSQLEPAPWANYFFGGPNGRPNVQGNEGKQKTISSSGCGCCSLSVILSGYTGQAVTPDMLTDILDETYTDGYYYSPGEGSRDCYYSNNSMLSKYFNCRGEACFDYTRAAQALRDGYAVIGAEEGHILAFVPAASQGDDARNAI